MSSLEELNQMLPDMEAEVEEAPTQTRNRRIGKYFDVHLMFAVFEQSLKYESYTTSAFQELLTRAPHIQELILGIQRMGLSSYYSSQDCGVVQKLFCCQEVRGVYHEYIILQIQEPTGTLSWARVERRTERKDVVMAGKYTPSFTPIDLATTASRYQDLINHGRNDIEPNDRIMEEMTFEDVHLTTVKRLLELFVNENTKYTPFKHNCWSFCLLMVDCMREYAPSQIADSELRRPGLLALLRQKIRLEFQQVIKSTGQCGVCLGSAQLPFNQPTVPNSYYSQVNTGWRSTPVPNYGPVDPYPNQPQQYYRGNGYFSHGYSFQDANGFSGYPQTEPTISMPTPHPHNHYV